MENSKAKRKMGNKTSRIANGDVRFAGGSIQSNMLRMLKDDVFKKYQVLEVLGSGSMGFVARAKIHAKKVGGSALEEKKRKNLMRIRPTSKQIETFREQSVEYALKSIQVDRISNAFLQELRNEIDILKGLDHPNIIKAYEVFENKRQIYMVLELCDGGDLYERGPYSEEQTRTITKQLLSAIKYMHDHGVVHRDLKFENIMWENNSPNAEIKVIDFGLSRKFRAGEKDIMSEGVGTIYTMAPQVLQGIYTSQADLWSCGVIIYMLLTSHRPFHSKNRNRLVDKIMRAKYDMSEKRWAGISEEAMDIVQKLIMLDPKQRLTATAALQHFWLSEEFRPILPQTDDKLDKQVVKNMIAYGAQSKLKKVAMNIVAYKSQSTEIMELKKHFDKYDESNDGIIDFQEFKAAMQDAKYSEEAIEKIFQGIDVNHSGKVEYTEFLASAIETYGLVEEERIAEAFDQLDVDNSGTISRAELISFLGRDADGDEVSGILREWDRDNDGMSKIYHCFVLHVCYC